MNTSTPPQTEIGPRLDAARRLARLAGKGTLKHFLHPKLLVEQKADASPVTIADREAETLIRESLAEEFPEDGIIGEEFGETEGNSGFRWIVDPIDGTKSFVAGVPLFGTMVGVEYQGKSLIGVVYIPGLDECVYAAKGQGAWHERGEADPVPAHVDREKSLGEGAFLTSQISTFAERGAAECFHELEAQALITRTWGDCYGYLLIATGRAVAMVDPIMSVWDAAALQPIMEEAGGTFTDWSGKPTIFSGEGIGTNGKALPEVLEICRKYVK